MDSNLSSTAMCAATDLPTILKKVRKTTPGCCGFSLTRPSGYRQRIPNGSTLEDGKMCCPRVNWWTHWLQLQGIIVVVGWLANGHPAAKWFNDENIFRIQVRFFLLRCRISKWWSWSVASKQHLVDLPQDEWSFFLHPSVGVPHRHANEKWRLAKGAEFFSQSDRDVLSWFWNSPPSWNMGLFPHHLLWKCNFASADAGSAMLPHQQRKSILARFLKYRSVAMHVRMSDDTWTKRE